MKFKILMLMLLCCSAYTYAGSSNTTLCIKNYTNNNLIINALELQDPDAFDNYYSRPDIIYNNGVAITPGGNDCKRIEVYRNTWSGLTKNGRFSLYINGQRLPLNLDDAGNYTWRRDGDSTISYDISYEKDTSTINVKSIKKEITNYEYKLCNYTGRDQATYTAKGKTLIIDDKEIKPGTCKNISRQDENRNYSLIPVFDTTFKSWVDAANPIEIKIKEDNYAFAITPSFYRGFAWWSGTTPLDISFSAVSKAAPIGWQIWEQTKDNKECKMNNGGNWGGTTSSSPTVEKYMETIYIYSDISPKPAKNQEYCGDRPMPGNWVNSCKWDNNTVSPDGYTVLASCQDNQGNYKTSQIDASKCKNFSLKNENGSLVCTNDEYINIVKKQINAGNAILPWGKK